MRSFGIFTLMVFGLGLGATACDIEDHGDAEPGDRASLVERAEQQVSLALENYADCESEPEPVCSSEEAELADALVVLDEARGDDALAFRSQVTADCAGGTTVTCEGHSCYVADNVGCACVSGQTLQSVGACPTPTPSNNNS